MSMSISLYVQPHALLFAGAECRQFLAMSNRNVFLGGMIGLTRHWFRKCNDVDQYIRGHSISIRASEYTTRRTPPFLRNY